MTKKKTTSAIEVAVMVGHVAGRMKCTEIISENYCNDCKEIQESINDLKSAVDQLNDMLRDTNYGADVK